MGHWFLLVHDKEFVSNFWVMKTDTIDWPRPESNCESLGCVCMIKSEAANLHHKLSSLVLCAVGHPVRLWRDPCDGDCPVGL